ncbi:MAG: hypothetical protein WDM76_03955 [Limisphaerales bacterium]
MPALVKAKERAWATACLSNLKQIGVASALYVDDSDQAFPRSNHEDESWVVTLQRYTGGTNLWRCPRDKDSTRIYSYAINDFLLPPPAGMASAPDGLFKNHQVPSPSETLFMTECADKYLFSDHFHFAPYNDGDDSPFNFQLQVAVTRHGRSANYLFTDFHVETIPWLKTQTKLTPSGSHFTNPGGKP